MPKSSVDVMIWGLLSNDSLIVFGEECGSAVVMMTLVLLLRSLITVMGLGTTYFSLVEVLVYSPYCIQFLMTKFPFMTKYPLLPVRVAESAMGRISSSELMMIIPAHVLGNILALTLFRTLCPFAPWSVFQPIVFDQWAPFDLVIVFTAVFMYVSVVLVTPDLLVANKASSKLLTIPTVPFLLLNLRKCSTLNPTTIYAMWYINHCEASWSPLLLLKEWYASNLSVLSSAGSQSLQLEYILISLFAALGAGLFLKRAFPDDGSWLRKKNMYID
jgi:hypothetical protein